MAKNDSPISDADIALMMAEENQEGLRILLRKYGGRIKAFLVKRYGGILQDGELDEVFSTTLFNVWRFAERYDESLGTLPSWCVRSAEWAAQDVLRGEKRHRAKHLEYDPQYDPAGDPMDPRTAVAKASHDDRVLDDLVRAIEELPPLQKAIIKADLAADGPADAGRLATIHGTDKNTIYVSRHKAKESLKKRLLQLGHRPHRMGSTNGK